MTRLSKVLIAAAAMIAVPLQTAFAEGEGEEAPPAEGTDGAPVEGAGGDAAPTPPDAGTEAPVGNAGAGVAVSSIIDRPLTLRKGQLAAHADILIAHLSISILGMTASSTSEGLALGAGYGVSDKLTVGGSYSFTLNEFEIKGPLTVYGAFGLADSGKLAVSAGADLSVNFASDNALAIHAGLAVRYKLAPKFALFTGNPYTPGPAGQHLSISLEDGGAKTFSLPVGFAFQATPQLYAFAGTNIATILLSDPGMGDRVTFIGDSIPFNIGAFFNVNKNIDAGGSFQTDLKGVGDFYVITLGARYFM
jgi:hypothetical protein